MDSPAPGLIRRIGTGRLERIQIKQFYLQNLLRAGAFSVFKRVRGQACTPPCGAAHLGHRHFVMTYVHTQKHMPKRLFHKSE